MSELKRFQGWDHYEERTQYFVDGLESAAIICESSGHSEMAQKIRSQAQEFIKGRMPMIERLRLS